MHICFNFDILKMRWFILKTNDNATRSKNNNKIWRFNICAILFSKTFFIRWNIFSIIQCQCFLFQLRLYLEYHFELKQFTVIVPKTMEIPMVCESERGRYLYVYPKCKILYACWFLSISSLGDNVNILYWGNLLWKQLDSRDVGTRHLNQPSMELRLPSG